ncbi:MAG TPA: FHA domain-containing protein [bacterium]|nr:FHA domain-containing protein [bacterium]
MQGGDKTIIHTGEADYGSLPADLYLSVEVIEGPDKGMTVSLTKSRTVIGRGPVEVQLHDPTVSSTHAAIEWMNNEVYVSDQNSSNGTFVNGERVERAAVGNMSEIKVGSTTLLFCMVRDVYGTFMPEDSPAQTQSQAAHYVDPNAATQVRGEVSNPMLPPALRVLLNVLDGPEAGRKFLLSKKATVIGRGEAVDVRINDEAVSRRHCQIVISNKSTMGLKDLASSNGTILNGRPVSAVKLSHNDVVEIGDTRLRIIVL